MRASPSLHFKYFMSPTSLKASSCSLPTSKCPKCGIRSNALQKFLNRPIQDFSICKKQKRRQEKQRLKLDWKKFVAEQWPCKIVRNCRIRLCCCFNRFRH